MKRYVRNSISTSKKGDLTLSINAIVILILAITMLGLGLMFIKNIFGGTAEKLEKMTSSLGEQERIELLSSQKDVTFLTTDIEIKERKKTLSFAIRNNRDTAATFQIKANINCYDALNGNKEDVTFTTMTEKKLEAGESFIVPLEISLEADAMQTTYLCTFELKAGSDLYKKIDFQITYKK